VGKKRQRLPNSLANDPRDSLGIVVAKAMPPEARFLPSRVKIGEKPVAKL